MYRKLAIYFRILISVLGRAISEAANIIAENMCSGFKDPTERKDPDWLDSLLGESPLLKSSESQFITDLRNHIIQEAKSRPSFSRDKRLKNKLSVMKDNFKEVVQYLKHCSLSKQYFMQTYPQWRNFRQRSITQLTNIAKALIINKQNAAAAMSLGSGASLIGGLVCLVTGVGALRLAGSVLMGLGSLAAAASSYSETELLRKKIKEAERIIREDKIYSEKLWYWISDMSSIQEALNSVTSINVGVDFQKFAADLHSSFKKSTEEGRTGIIEKFVKSLVVYPEVADEFSDVIGILTTISMLHDRFRPLFKQTIEAYKCYRILSTACVMIASTAKMASAVNASASCKLTSFQACRIYTGIALDVLNLIRASESLNSKSEEAVEIIKAAEKLEEEAQVFYKLYEAVK